MTHTDLNADVWASLTAGERHLLANPDDRNYGIETWGSLARRGLAEFVSKEFLAECGWYEYTYRLTDAGRAALATASPPAQPAVDGGGVGVKPLTYAGQSRIVRRDVADWGRGALVTVVLPNVDVLDVTVGQLISLEIGLPHERTLDNAEAELTTLRSALADANTRANGLRALLASVVTATSKGGEWTGYNGDVILSQLSIDAEKLLKAEATAALQADRQAGGEEVSDE